MTDLVRRAVIDETTCYFCLEADGLDVVFGGMPPDQCEHEEDADDPESCRCVAVSQEVSEGGL